MFVNSSENEAQESHQGFFSFTRAVETETSQRAEDFGMDMDAQVLGKAGLYQRMQVRGSLTEFSE